MVDVDSWCSVTGPIKVKNLTFVTGKEYKKLIGFLPIKEAYEAE